MNRKLLPVACAAALLLPAAVLAHARLSHSIPGDRAQLRDPPKAITLQFSEPPEVALTTITMSASGGEAVPLGPVERLASAERSVTAKILGAVAPGAYRISWTTAASDGHPSKGTFTFELLGVGAPPALAPPHSARAVTAEPTTHVAPAPVADQPEGFGVESPLYVIIRWLQFTAILVIIGAVAFRQLVLSFLKRKEDPDSAMIPDAARNAAHLGQKASAVLLAVLVIRLVAQSYMMHGGMGGVAPGMMGSMVTETLWGRGWVLGLLGVAIAGLGFYKARNIDVSKWWSVATAGALIVAFSPAFAGHASSSSRFATLAILADGLHVISAGGWLGSLLMVAAVGIPAALRLPRERRGPMVAEVVNAFSPTALMFAGLIAATGVFAAWLHLGSVVALWTSNYGKTLLVKLAILSIVAGTGAYNWLRVKPHLGHLDGATKMKRSATVELAVGVLVLLVTAVLVAVATPRDADLKSAAPYTVTHQM